jgi:hypothetical protein
MRFISEQRFNDENLVWQDAITEADRIIDPELFKHAYYKIVDADGVVYTGIIKEDGRVDDGYTTWDSLDTYKRFDQPAKAVADKQAGYIRETLYWNRDTNQFFVEYSHKNVCEVCIWSVPAEHIADWFITLGEREVIALPETDHLVISLPRKLQQDIAKVAYAERISERDWIARRLGECVSDERSPASLAKQEDYTGVDKTRVAEILARILSKTADRENGENRQTFGETETQATTASQPEAV